MGCARSTGRTATARARERQRRGARARQRPLLGAALPGVPLPGATVQGGARVSKALRPQSRPAAANGRCSFAATYSCTYKRAQCWPRVHWTYVAHTVPHRHSRDCPPFPGQSRGDWPLTSVGLSKVPSTSQASAKRVDRAEPRNAQRRENARHTNCSTARRIPRSARARCARARRRTTCTSRARRHGARAGVAVDASGSRRAAFRRVSVGKGRAPRPHAHTPAAATPAAHAASNELVPGQRLAARAAMDPTAPIAAFFTAAQKRPTSSPALLSTPAAHLRRSHGHGERKPDRHACSSRSPQRAPRTRSKRPRCTRRLISSSSKGNGQPSSSS